MLPSQKNSPGRAGGNSIVGSLRDCTVAFRSVRASRMLSYPVHRHKLPERISCMLVGVNFLPVSYAAKEDMATPGVQNPHCVPFLCSRACCTGCNFPFFAMPSMVIRCLPSSMPSNIRHAFAAYNTVLPAVSFCARATMQEPQSPVPQPSFVPVIFLKSLRYFNTVIWGSGVPYSEKSKATGSPFKRN